MTLHPHLIRLFALADQVAFSVANFVLMVLLGRHYAASELADFGMGLSIALMVQSTLRNCYIVQYSVLPAPVFVKRGRALLGEQAVLMILVFVIEALFLGLWWGISPSSFSLDLCTSTLACSLIYMQLEFDRIVNLKFHQYIQPFVSSVIFLFLNGLLFYAGSHFALSFTMVMLVQGLYAVGRVMWLCRSVGMPHWLLGTRVLKRDFKRYLVSSLVGAAGYSGYTHIPIFILRAYSDAVNGAAFVAMRGLTQPLQIIIRSLDLVDKNFFHQRSGGTAEGARRLIYRQLAVYGTLGLVTIVGIIVAGQFIIDLAYKQKYSDFFSVYLAWGLVFSLMALNSPLQTIILRQGKLNAMNNHRLIAGIVGIALAFLLTPRYGALGATYAVGAGWLVANLLALKMVWPELRNPGTLNSQPMSPL